MQIPTDNATSLAAHASAARYFPFFQSILNT